jgi:hypothetical protein
MKLGLPSKFCIYQSILTVWQTNFPHSLLFFRSHSRSFTFIQFCIHSTATTPATGSLLVRVYLDLEQLLRHPDILVKYLEAVDIGQPRRVFQERPRRSSADDVEQTTDHKTRFQLGLKVLMI